MTNTVQMQATTRSPGRVGECANATAAPARIRRSGVLGRGAGRALRAAMLVMLGFTASPGASDEARNPASSEWRFRIVSGNPTDAGEWPWSVALMDISGRWGPREHYCGGSVIAPRWVLTAAHCVDNGVAPEEIQALVGTNDLDSGGTRINVRSILVHEGYSPGRTPNDIALLELARPAPVPAVAIPDRARTAEAAAPGTTATAVGWGLLRDVELSCEPGEDPRGSECTARGGVVGHHVEAETGQPVKISDLLPSRLMEVDLPLVDERSCREAYPDETVDHRNLCAGFAQGGKDSCKADSGGPLVVRDGNEWLQAGVVSWGEGCARPGKYGVYTNVGVFASWIEARTGLALASSAEASPAPVATATDPLSEPASTEELVTQGTDPEPHSEPASTEELVTQGTDPEPHSEPASTEELVTQDTDSGLLPSAAAVKGGRALLVCVNRYADPRIQDLRGAVADGRNMRRLLVEHLGYEPEGILMLVDQEATREAILSAIEHWLIDGTRAGDRALLYYAGHGYFQVDRDGDEADGYDEVLVPHDARRISSDTHPMQLSNLIGDDEVAKLLDELHDRQVSVIVDSGHSGTMTLSAAPGSTDQRYVRTLLTPDARDFGRRDLESAFARSALAARQRDTGFIEARGNVVAWSAVSPLQLALEDREAGQPQGVFTRRFIRGIAKRLADRDGDGFVSHAELLDYVRAESEAYCLRHQRHCQAGLTPTLQAHRDLLLVDVASGTRLGADEVSTAGGALAHDNSARVALDIWPSSRLRFEEPIRYLVRSARSGHLLIVNVAPDGKVYQMFPNPISDEAGTGTVIEAERTVEIGNPYSGFAHQGRAASGARIPVRSGDRGSGFAHRSPGTPPRPQTG